MFFLGGGEETVGIIKVISSKASPKKCFTSGHVRPSAVQKGKSELERGSDEIACSDVKVIRFFTFKTLPLDTFQPLSVFLSFFFQLFKKPLQLARQAWIWTFGLEDTQVTTKLREDERHRKVLEVLTQHGKKTVLWGSPPILQATFNREIIG